MRAPRESDDRTIDMRKVGITVSLAGIVLSAAFLLLRSALPASGEGYRCAQNWKGPAVTTIGGILPIPRGYALVDRSASPHLFNNFAAALDGAPLGIITVGTAQGYHEAPVSDHEFVREHTTWRRATRTTTTQIQSGMSTDQFVFLDDFVLSFTGAALPYAEAVAGCYADLISSSAGEP
ncbi:MAG: hypothetical protein EA384_10380 [Spirochaetaceae bacterium]|nr:MAG: hypothetical protein EA384_10380 [Spirochaetaceae bacterium]